MVPSILQISRVSLPRSQRISQVASLTRVPVGPARQSSMISFARSLLFVPSLSRNEVMGSNPIRATRVPLCRAHVLARRSGGLPSAHGSARVLLPGSIGSPFSLSCGRSPAVRESFGGRLSAARRFADHAYAGSLGCAPRSSRALGLSARRTASGIEESGNPRTTV